MSVMRKVLLAGSTNAWLRERATKAAFVRRSVSAVHGRASGSRTRCAAARELQPQGITTILTALGENLTTAEEAEEVTQHYLDVFDKVAAAGLDAQISVKPTQLGLDLDRGDVRAQPRSAARTRRAAQQLPVDRHGELAVRRSDARAVPARAGEVAAHRHRAPGLPVSHGEGRRIADPARARDPDRQGRVSRAAGRSPIRRSRTSTRTSTSCASGCCRPRRSAPARCCTSPPTTWRSPSGWPPTPASTRSRRRPTSSRCSTASASSQQKRLAAERKRLRVLISYGEYWFPWYMRRLAERPANVWFVVKNMFG